MRKNSSYLSKKDLFGRALGCVCADMGPQIHDGRLRAVLETGETMEGLAPGSRDHRTIHDGRKIHFQKKFGALLGKD